MATSLNITQEFPASPADIFALYQDRDFVQGRLEASGGIDPEVTSLDITDSGVAITTKQSIPADALPSMVASMMAGDPVTERVETWKQDGDGYAADFTVTVKGAPASLKGTMVLTREAEGSTLSVDASATVPIPMFGSKIEEVIVEQVSGLLNKEGDYTRTRLGG